MDLVNGQAATFKFRGLTFRQVPGDGFGGEVRAFGYPSHGLIPVLREAQLYFVINEIQVDNSVDVGLIVANRAFYCRDFCGAWSDVEYTDFIRRNTLIEIFFTGEDGCQVHGLF